MRTKLNGAFLRACALTGLTALALGAAGCASTGEKTAAGGAHGGETPTGAQGRGSFYADWYEASAVVLPPPPAMERARR